MKSLKKARTDAGFTLVEASKRLGITPNTLSNYERGKSLPNVRTVKMIESLYGINFQDIFFDYDCGLNAK